MEFTIIASLLFGVLVSAMADCDINRCMKSMLNLDYTNMKKVCTDMNTTVSCLENVMETCPSLKNSKSSVQQQIDKARMAIKGACSGSTQGVNIPAACDATKCIEALVSVDYSNSAEACPALDSSIVCLQGVVDGCNLGEYKTQTQNSINLSRENYNKYCSKDSGSDCNRCLIGLVFLAFLFNTW